MLRTGRHESNTLHASFDPTCHATLRVHRLHPARAHVLRGAPRAPGHDRRTGRAPWRVEEPPDEGRQRPGAPGPDRDHARARRRPAAAEGARGHPHRRRRARHGNRLPARRMFRPPHQPVQPDAELPPEACLRRRAAGLFQGPWTAPRWPTSDPGPARRHGASRPAAAAHRCGGGDGDAEAPARAREGHPRRADASTRSACTPPVRHRFICAGHFTCPTRGPPCHNPTST